MAVKMKQSFTPKTLQPGLPRKSKSTGSSRPGWTDLGNGLLMLLLGLGIFSNPSFQRRPSVSQAEDAYPNCRPILFDEIHSGFEDPSPSHLRMVGNTMGSQQDERTWEIPSLNSVSGTGHGTNASPFWRFGKLSLLVQKANNTAVSLFSGKMTLQLLFADFFLQDCEREQQSTSALDLRDNPQLTGAQVRQDDTPAETDQAQSDEKTGADSKQSTDDRAQAKIFVGTVIDEEGANLRSGPGLDYAIVDRWAKGQQFPFEMVSADGEWLRIDEGLWISASIVAGQEISETPTPDYVDGPEQQVPIYKASDLSQEVSTQEEARIFLGAVSVRDGANIRFGPGLEREIVSAVSFGSLIAWVAMSEDREWLYLQNGHWVYADLVSEPRVFRIINASEEIEPVDDLPVTEVSQEHFGWTDGKEYFAPVISETSAGIRSGPGSFYELGATKLLDQNEAYVAQSDYRYYRDWTPLRDGKWAASSYIGTRGSVGVYTGRPLGRHLGPSSTEGLEMGEGSEPSIELMALRQQAYEYVNEARTSHGLPPVRLGNNQVAQLQAAESIRHRTWSPWTETGLTRAMLYTLAGGEGYREVSAAHMGTFELIDCILEQDRAYYLDLMLEVLESKPRNLENIQRPEHSTVNLGIAFDCRAMAVVLEFEGEYVSYLDPPTIQEGLLTMEGRLLNSAKMDWIGENVGIWIHYLPPPVPLTRGQLFRGVGECLGIPVAAIMTQRPLISSNEDIAEGFEKNSPPCLPPYAFDPKSEPPQNEEEARHLLATAANTIPESELETHFGPMILPDTWQVHEGRFVVQADLSSILTEHGPGVYMVNLLGSVNDTLIKISEYAIFVD